MRTSFILFLMAASFACLKGQETVINLSFSQPRELKINAGDDLVSENSEVTLGTNIQITGGTPAFQYQWKQNDSVIAVSKSISVTRSGKYIVVVTDSRNCTASDTVTVLFMLIPEIKYDSKCRIFPNPTSTYLNIEIADYQNVHLVSIFSEEGRKILSIQQKQIQGNNILVADVSFLPKGMYFVTVASPDSGCTATFIKH